MNQNSLSAMEQKLHERERERRETAQKTADEELMKLSKALRTRSRKELTTILTDIESATAATAAATAADLNKIRTQTRQLTRAWIRPAIIGIALVIGLTAGTWGLSSAVTMSINSKLKTRAAISAEIDNQRRVLAEIQAGTLGIDIKQIEGHSYIVLPPAAEPGYKVNNRPAIKITK